MGLFFSCSIQNPTSYWFFKQEADWMIYLICVVKGQLDHVFSFKDKHTCKTEQDLKIITSRRVHVQRLKCSFSGLCTILFNSYENYNISYNTCTCRCTRKIIQKVIICKFWLHRLKNRKIEVGQNRNMLKKWEKIGTGQPV